MKPTLPKLIETYFQASNDSDLEKSRTQLLLSVSSAQVDLIPRYTST